MIKETTGIITLIPENIPEELTGRRQWVAWRCEERDGQQTKIPYEPGTLRRASATDLMTWTSFEKAVEAYEFGYDDLGPEDHGEPFYDGVGFCFSSGDPFVGIDLDKCRNPETGEIAPWAQQILDRVGNGYIEVSPSGRGVHVIIKGSVRAGGMRKGPIEMYSRNRYFALTGHLL
jgi:primase-polymerase (primpol)-like protein